ncbi:MAG TPA: tRNA 2-thiouridine(34) synthase MnmA [Phycisphaerales bacterium]|nr:tRNA 2-thiouridine(34) synthase MnmA [Phycisphaerales bacterium]
MSSRKPKVLLAMSGGVDSSVAAALLLEQGYDVVGCFMRLGSPGEELEGLQEVRDESLGEASHCVPGQRSESKKKIRIGHQGCCSINDAADARLVAAHLGIPFYVCNFKQDFNRVIDYFVAEYNAGRTPNPCVRCNDWLKFGKLHEYARQIEADFVASGHYARIDDSDGGHPRIRRGVDTSKDQSYVLFGTPAERLAQMLLPVGNLYKPHVREIARRNNLPVFDKPDSQEICFVPDNDYAALVAARTPAAVGAGDILNREGEAIGTHEGHQHFTVGQRKGIRVSANIPLYVVNKNAERNTITVGPREMLFSSACTADQANWFTPPSTESWLLCTAKIRYNSPPVGARVRAIEGDGESRAIEVRFDEAQQAVAPGQAVVCYDEQDRIICGGWIDTATSC